VPGSLAIISASFHERDRGQAIGTWSAFTAITAAVGPVLGGWLIEHISWRAIFFINLPLALLVLMFSFRSVPESRDEDAVGKLDWLGGVLAVIGLGSIVYGLLESSRAGFARPAILIALLAGILFLIAFLLWERRTPNPMLPLNLFRSRDFSGANLLTFFLYSALSGTFFFLPLNLIQVHGYKATAAGAALLPFILIIFVLSRWAGGLVDRYGAKLPLVVGPLIAAAGFAMCILPGIGGSYWATFFPAVIVLGLGMGISVAPLTTTVMNAVPERRVGIASGINNAISRTGGLLAIALLGIVMLQSFNRALDRNLSSIDLPTLAREVVEESRSKLAGVTWPREINAQSRAQLARTIDDSFVTAFRHVMAIGVALALASSVSALALIANKQGRFGKQLRRE
jgi:EmrB/QacA subfamily drug resistance transporter